MDMCHVKTLLTLIEDCLKLISFLDNQLGFFVVEDLADIIVQTSISRNRYIANKTSM